MRPVTFLRSNVMRLLASPGYASTRNRVARIRARLRGEPRAVHYFHQVDDPYSHLAVQKLDRLIESYPIPFQVHLVSGPAPAYQGSSEHFENWALRDAASVAARYGTTLEAHTRPSPAAVDAANATLAPVLGDARFARAAIAVGEALWRGDPVPAGGSDTDGHAAVAAGDALRRRLGHYQGGMFHLDGEWFWGVDRIRHLEARLMSEGLGSGSVLVPEPSPADAGGLDADRVVLEYFPSLRSPYTAVGHARVLDLVERSGVSIRLRPVMPMLMRGVPAPSAKQRYIITDAAREARARGVPFGRIVDPFGNPVRRAFALFPGAVALGRGMAFVTAYLRAAWADGVDITTEHGLRTVAARAEVDWQTLTDAASGVAWETELGENLNDMLGAGLWGVPSFRVTGGNDPAPFACWGQDRIWRVEDEIARRMR